MGTGFLPFAFTVIFFVVIQPFLDRKLFISDTADIFRNFPIVLGGASLGVSSSPEYLEFGLFWDH